MNWELLAYGEVSSPHHSTFFIFGDREKSERQNTDFCFFVSASHPLSISALLPNNIHGNNGRDKIGCFPLVHNFFSSLSSLPSYNDLGWIGYTPNMSSSNILPPFCKTSQGVSSHLSLISPDVLHGCNSNTKNSEIPCNTLFTFKYLNLSEYVTRCYTV